MNLALALFEHVTCMQMILFLVCPREGWEAGEGGVNYLNSLMPLFGIIYN